MVFCKILALRSWFGTIHCIPMLLIIMMAKFLKALIWFAYKFDHCFHATWRVISAIMFFQYLVAKCRTDYVCGSTFLFFIHVHDSGTWWFSLDLSNLFDETFLQYSAAKCRGDYVCDSFSSSYIHVVVNLNGQIWDSRHNAGQTKSTMLSM